MFLSKKNRELLINIIMANQIILNAYNKLEGFDQIQAFSQFCENSANALFLLGGSKAVDEAKEYIFINDSNRREKTK